jgi:hypothetical protein
MERTVNGVRTDSSVLNLDTSIEDLLSYLQIRHKYFSIPKNRERVKAALEGCDGNQHSSRPQN